MTMMILIEQGKLQALLHPVLEQVLLFLLVERNLIEASGNANETIQVTSAVTSSPRTSTIVSTSSTEFDGSEIIIDDDDDTNETIHSYKRLLHPVLEQVLLFLLVVRNLMEAE
jgi:hypothetical protein